MTKTVLNVVFVSNLPGVGRLRPSYRTSLKALLPYWVTLKGEGNAARIV